MSVNEFADGFSIVL